MNQPFNQPRRSRWPDLDSRRPENMPFADWAEEQTRRSHNDHGPWFTAEQIADAFERLLQVEAARRERGRKAKAEGWVQGEPGE